MDKTVLKEEILRLFSELSPEEQADYYEKVKKMLFENAMKAEREE